MFFDPFTFTPPHPDVLTRAVESYQRVAAVRFCRYARDAMDPDLLPLEVRGDLLDPTPKQLHAEVRALRHLTAIQRTLRDIGGPLFDPDSPISPEKRFQLVERRLDAIDEALGAPSEETIQRIVSCPQDGSAFSSSDFSSDDRLRPLRLENSSSSDLSPVDSPRSPRSPRLGNSSSAFPSSSSADKPDFYHPPEIEDLLEAVNFAQRVFAARAELLDKRRLSLSPEDFLLEISSLRDLTSIVRTLRRMSAKPLQEDGACDDFSIQTTARPDAPSTAEGDAADASDPSHRSRSPHSSHGANQSVESVKSEDRSDSGSDILDMPPATRSRTANDTGFIHSLEGDRPLRPVPRVPEVRKITPPNGAASTTSDLKSETHHLPRSYSSESAPSLQSADRLRSSSSSSSSSRFASLSREEDLYPWGNWETPPPEAIDESAPEFLADMKRYGYSTAWRRAADRLREKARVPSALPSDHSAAFLPPDSILSDSDPPGTPPPDDTS